MKTLLIVTLWVLIAATIIIFAIIPVGGINPQSAAYNVIYSTLFAGIGWAWLVFVIVVIAANWKS